MAATISESYLSRSFTVGQQAVRELVFDIQGAADDVAAQAIINATAPNTYLGFFLDSVNADPIDGNGIWKGYARYTKLQLDNEYTFDTGGGTQRITQSLGTIAKYAPSGETAPDFMGAIGVSQDRVEGVDITVPQYQFTETHYFTQTDVTSAYKYAIFQLTGKMNNAPFRNFAAGEVLFLGAAGSVRSDENWSITFRFACSPNATGLSIGGTIPEDYYYDEEDVSISGIDKIGWDYMWVRYEDFEDDAAFVLVKQPTAVYIERVYHPGDFSTLNIGTT